jgi:hypothetical protein
MVQASLKEQNIYFNWLLIEYADTYIARPYDVQF